MTASRLVIPDLAGKTVLITGGSTGIGAAVARGFAEQGARVAIGYHSSADKAHALVSEIKAAGGEALAVKGDVADPKACARNCRRNDEPIRRPRRPYQQCRPHARAGALARGERRACPGGDRSQLAFNHLGDTRRKALARASGRFRHQYDVNCGAKRRRRRRHPLRRRKGVCLDDHQRPRQGADRQKDSRQCRVARRDHDAVSRALYETRTPWRPFARRFRSLGSEPPKNASALTCSSPRRRSAPMSSGRLSRSMAASLCPEALTSGRSAAPLPGAVELRRLVSILLDAGCPKSS